MKRSWGIKILALFSALAVAFIIVLCGGAVAPPRYTAENNFQIEWELLPMRLALKNRQAISQLRAEAADKVTHADYRQLAQRFCQHYQMPDSSAAPLAKKLDRFLKITKTGSQGSQDFFRVQFRDQNGQAASLVCLDVVGQLKAIVVNDVVKKAFAEEGKVLGTNDNLLQKKSDLEAAIHELKLEQNQQYSSEREQQIQEYAGELDKLGNPDMGASHQALGFMMDIFRPLPVQTNQTVIWKKRGPAYGIFVLSVAALGGIAAGFLVTSLASRKNIPPKIGAAPPVPPKL